MNFPLTMASLVVGGSLLLSQTESRAQLAVDNYGPNLYWPGDFEHRFEGGIFGSQKNAKITPGPSHGKSGKQSWEILPGYQHLELLVPSHRKGKLSFRALASEPQTFVLKIVNPGPEGPAPGTHPSTIDQTLEITPSGDWRRYEMEFETRGSWPKPPVSEILLTFFKQSEGTVRIDDLQIHMESDPEIAPGMKPEIPPLPANAFADFRIGSEKQNKEAVNFVQHVLDPVSIRGRKVRISAEVTYLSMDGDINNWGSILFVLRQGDATGEKILEPEGSWPFWAPIGHANPPGQPRRISALYEIPADAKELTLTVQAQDGIGPNIAKVDQLAFEVID